MDEPVNVTVAPQYVLRCPTRCSRNDTTVQGTLSPAGMALIGGGSAEQGFSVSAFTGKNGVVCAMTLEGSTVRGASGAPVVERIEVEGFKSIRSRIGIDVRPLTVLAGANSAGKSSMTQPLLLIKQSLSGEPRCGALRLDGPLVQFLSARDFLPRQPRSKGPRRLTVGLGVKGDRVVRNVYHFKHGRVELAETFQRAGSKELHLTVGAGGAELKAIIDKSLGVRFRGPISNRVLGQHVECFQGILQVAYDFESEGMKLFFSHSAFPGFSSLHGLHYVPGVRCAWRRLVSLGGGLGTDGPIDQAVAPILYGWQQENCAALEFVSEGLRQLHLASGLSVKPRGPHLVSLEVEQRFGRTRQSSNLSDVGAGVSQVLPVLVALERAGRDDLVIIEQPELHLHPNAQWELADLMVRVINRRRCRAIVETHSALFLLRLQTLIAEQETLNPKDVSLNWFQLDSSGSTEVFPAEVGADGSVRAWPASFGDYEVLAHDAYIRASAKHYVSASGRAGRK